MPARNETRKTQTINTADTAREITVRRTTTSDADHAAGSLQQADAVATDSSPLTVSSTSALRFTSATDIDMDKVAAIRAALRDGSYSINSGTIADGMAEHGARAIEKLATGPEAGPRLKLNRRVTEPRKSGPDGQEWDLRGCPGHGRRAIACQQ